MLLSANTKLVKNWILKEVKIVKIVQLYVNNLHLSLKLYYLCRGLYSPDHHLLQSTYRAWARLWHKCRRFWNSFFLPGIKLQLVKNTSFFQAFNEVLPKCFKTFCCCIKPLASNGAIEHHVLWKSCTDSFLLPFNEWWCWILQKI